MSLATALGPQDVETANQPKGKKAPRATSRRASQVDIKPKKVSFYLSPVEIQRLGVIASMLATDKSKALSEVLASSPLFKRFVVSDRARTDACDTGVIGEPDRAA